MVVGDLGLTGILAPLVVAVGSKLERGSAIIQNPNAVVQIVLLMDQPVWKLRNAMKIVAQVGKRLYSKTISLVSQFLVFI